MLATASAIGLSLVGATAGTANAAGGSNPIGAYDTLAHVTGGFRVTGWCYDADAPIVPCDVHIYVDGALFKGLNAGRSRPDVAAAIPGAGSNHGFLGEYPYNSPGPHLVCVYAINLGGGNTNPLLGCKTITFPGVVYDSLHGSVYYLTREASLAIAGGNLGVLGLIVKRTEVGIFLALVTPFVGAALASGKCLYLHSSGLLRPLGTVGTYNC